MSLAEYQIDFVDATWFDDGHREKSSNTCEVVDTGLTNEEIIEKIQKRPELLKLWIAEPQKLAEYANEDGTPDRSQSDFALLSALAYYTGRDTDRMVEIFKQSAIYRPEKAEQLHGHYPHYSAKRAAQECKEVYKSAKLKGSGYFIKNDAFFFLKNKGEEAEPVKLTNFIAEPEREILLDDGVNTDLYFEIRGEQSGRRLPTVRINSKEFAGMTWLNCRWPMSVAILPGNGHRDRVRYILQFLASGIPRETLYSHLGWRKIDGQWLYLHAGGAIGTGESPTVQFSNDRLKRYSLPSEPGSESQNIKTALKFLETAPLTITAPLFCTVFLSVLCEPLREAGIEPTFLTAIVGRTQSLKSSLVAVALSFFGDFDRSRLPGSFKDTAGALEKLSSAIKDSLFVVDDLFPTTSRLEAQKMATTLQSLCRGYGDRNGRARLDCDAKTIKAAYVPRGCGVITAEFLPSVGQSALSRLLALNIKPGDVDTTKLGELQSDTEPLRRCMAGFIRYLADRMASHEFPTELRKKFNELRAEALQSDLKRLPEIVSWLLLGAQVFIEYAKSVQALTEHEAEKLFNEIRQAIAEAMQEHSEIVREESPAQMYVSALRESISSGLLKPGNVNHLADGAIVYEDNEFYYLTRFAFSYVRQFWSEQGTQFPTDEKAVLKIMAQEGLIETRNGETRIQKKIGGINQRVVVMKQSVFNW